MPQTGWIVACFSSGAAWKGDQHAPPRHGVPGRARVPSFRHPLPPSALRSGRASPVRIRVLLSAYPKLHGGRMLEKGPEASLPSDPAYGRRGGPLQCIAWARRSAHRPGPPGAGASVRRAHQPEAGGEAIRRLPRRRDAQRCRSCGWPAGAHQPRIPRHRSMRGLFHGPHLLISFPLFTRARRGQAALHPEPASTSVLPPA